MSSMAGWRHVVLAADDDADVSKLTTVGFIQLVVVSVCATH